MAVTSNFPFKTLIWALVAALALFLFKAELKQLLGNAEELNVFGIKIKASQDKVDKLKDSIANFETKIADLSNQVNDQQVKIKSLDELKIQLEKDLSNCPEAKKNGLLMFNAQLIQLYDTSTKLKKQSDHLKNVNILKEKTIGNQ